MIIGGSSYDVAGLGLDDVELLSLDPILDPVPDCITQLRPLPSSIRAAAGALDKSSKNMFYQLSHCSLYTTINCLIHYVLEMTLFSRWGCAIHLWW